MIKFNALEKLFVKIDSIVSFKNNKKIVNKNSPNYGSQTIADTVINNTQLTNKTRADIRKLEIDKIGERLFKARAIYVDSSTDDTFKAHWYAWQNIHGKPPVWTPMGTNNTVDLGQSRFISLSAWVNDQPNEVGASENISSEVYIGDESW
jgi:hypothetical protein